MTSQAKVVVGLLAGVAVGVGAYLLGSSGSTTNGAQGLTGGHRYRVTMLAAPNTTFPAQTVAGLAGYVLTHYPALKFVSLDVATTQQVIFTVDATLDLPGPIVFQSGAATTFTDMGLSPQSSNTGPQTTIQTWQRATTQINPGAMVRGSISEATFATVAQSQNLPNTFAGFQQMLSNPVVTANLSTASIAAWGPNQALPLDWPTDDPSPTTEYHFQFTYGGTVPIPLSSFPFAGTLWQKV